MPIVKEGAGGGHKEKKWQRNFVVQSVIWEELNDDKLHIAPVSTKRNFHAECNILIAQ